MGNELNIIRRIRHGKDYKLTITAMVIASFVIDLFMPELGFHNKCLGVITSMWWLWGEV